MSSDENFDHKKAAKVANDPLRHTVLTSEVVPPDRRTPLTPEQKAAQDAANAPTRSEQ